MAGRIREESIAEVREKAPIEEVVSQYVTLKNAGGGSMKGLCPFHDEKTPSFNVNTARGFYHCLAAETRVLTWEGVRPIRELAGGTHRILGSRGDWIEAPFKSYGAQRLHKITLTRNRQVKQLFATDGHRWFVRGEHNPGTTREVVTAALSAGDSLVSRFPRRWADRSRRHALSPGRVRATAFVTVGTRVGEGHPSGPEEAVALNSLSAEADSADWVVQSVEPTDRVEEVFCAEVEDGNAFTLEDNILTGNCFGCGEGGGVIDFVMKMDGLSFVETVERLAEKYGVELKREEGDSYEERAKGPARGKLIEAHRVAQEFYAEQLLTPDAAQARQFLTERGFDSTAAETFGLGFAPREGEALFKHLRARGFSAEEVVAGGLAALSQRGGSPYDRFRARLLWPIREASGETIGFGARRIFDDDRIEAKYLNTSDTPIYKKSRVLYGIDLARREMGRSSQAVVVEGYTDVMACHLAGVKTAVASCGTAFGDEHAKVLRRYMADHEEFRGEVVFTFDGDAAGQAAAIKAFSGDQNFVSQTYVAVEPDGLDPCDVRIKKGDAAVRELVARRVPLYRFVVGNIVSKYDLDRADGRVDAMRETARLVASIRDQSKVTAFAQEISKMIGAEVDTNAVLAEVRRARKGPQRGSAPVVVEEQPAAPRNPLPHLRDPRFTLERETLKLVLQHPMSIGRTTTEIGADDFTHPTYRAVWALVEASGGTAAGADDHNWMAGLRERATDPAVAAAVSELGVEPLKKEPTAAYVTLHIVGLLELTALRRIADLKSKLQRTNPVENAETFNRMFGELAALEEHRRKLRDRIVGQQ